MNMPPASSSARVLVIDDEPSARSIIAAVLSQEGHQLHFAEDGPRGLALAREVAPQAICCDMMMPGMTGLEVCARLKADPATRHLPIIAVTALDSREILADVLAAGADDFVGKPIHAFELRARLRSMIRISRQYEQLAAALQLRADLTSMIVHDLRGPLSGMLLATDLVRVDPLTAQQETAIGALEDAARRLNRMIRDLLAMGRIEAGHLPMTRTDEPLGPLCDRALATFRPLAESRALRLERPPGPADAVPVAVDLALMERVVENLLSNAVKFSSAGGRITVRVDRAAPGRGASIEVADEGAGIPAQLRERIFEKYEVGEVRSRISQIGLGLAFCKLVAEAHGGSIACRPNLPRGTVFNVQWPA